jgi:hypothetical protein
VPNGTNRREDAFCSQSTATTKNTTRSWSVKLDDEVSDVMPDPKGRLNRSFEASSEWSISGCLQGAKRSAGLVMRWRIPLRGGLSSTDLVLGRGRLSGALRSLDVKPDLGMSV